MATNRYTQLSYSNLNDLPLLQLPFEELNNLVMASQKSKDEYDAIAEMTPKYIKDSESDTALKNTISAYQAQVTNQLADIASSGDAVEYRRQLNNAKKAIVNMWKPGGPANALEQRYEQEQKRIKDLEEYFKDNKLVQEMYKRDYNYNDIEYDPETGGFKSLAGQSYFRDINDEEISKWFLEHGKAVKDVLFNEGYTDIPFDNITTIRDFFQIKGVPYSKLIEVFEKTMPQDFKNSILQKHRALRFFNPNIPEPGDYLYETEKDDKGKTKIDDNGNVVFKREPVLDAKGKQVINPDTGEKLTKLVPDMTNPFMKLYSGYGDIFESENITHDRIVLKNYIELERQKLALKKESEAAEYIPRANVANVPGAPEQLTIDTNGMIVIGTQTTTRPGYSAGIERDVLGTGPKTTNTKVSAITAFKDGSLAKVYPEAKAVYDEYKNDPVFKGYSDVQKSKFLTSLLNNALAKRQTFTFTINQPTDNAEGVKLRKTKKEAIVGKDDTLGSISGRPLFLIDGNGNIISDAKSAQNIIDEYFGGNVEEFIKKTGWQGDSQSDNPVVASSDILTFQVDKKGLFGGKPLFGPTSNSVRLLVSNDSYVQADIKSQIYIGNQAMTNAQGKSLPIYAEILPGDSPELQQVLMQNPVLEVRRKPILLHQDLKEQLQIAQKAFKDYGKYTDPLTNVTYDSQAAFSGYVKEKSNEINTVQRSTKLNTVRYEPEVYNYRTNQLIGRKSFWDQYVARIEDYSAKQEFSNKAK